MTGTGAENISGEQQVTQAEICTVSAEAAAQIAGPIFTELENAKSVLYRTATERIAGLPLPDRLAIASLLHPDTARSGINVERWRLQGGKLHEEAANKASPNQAITICGDAANMPRL